MSDHQVTVKNVVLHILDTNVGAPVISHRELSSEEEGHDFVEKLIGKALTDDHLKEAVFNEGVNPVREQCERFNSGEIDLLELSRNLADRFYELISHHPDIPSADMAFAKVGIDGRPYLAVLKLNYRTNFIHQVLYDGEAPVTTLLKQKTVLPGENQKPDECFLINLENLGIQLMEKEYELDGVKEFYLSKRFLACGSRLSTAEKARIISKVAETVSRKYDHDKFEGMARLRKTVAETMDADRSVAVEKVAQGVFRDNPAAQREYVEAVQQAGIREDRVQFSERITERKFNTQKIKTDTGIEINFPSAYYNNRDMIEFINNPNGTVSIVIKNVGKISNKG